MNRIIRYLEATVHVESCLLLLKVHKVVSTAYSFINTTYDTVYIYLVKVLYTLNRDSNIVYWVSVFVEINI